MAAGLLVGLWVVLSTWFVRFGESYRRLATRSNREFLEKYNQTFSRLPEQFETTPTHHRSLSEASHLVSSLPGLQDIALKHYAGHVLIDEAKDSNIFYWLFEAPQNADSLPLLVWLNGGPGCSSMDGLWLELGPLNLDSSGNTVTLNKHSWHTVANVLFVDQPVGTGFAYTKSKSGYAASDDMVNIQFYTFLQGFFKLHPRYVSTVNGRQVTRPFFMSGESHAGHYIPTMAAHIMQKNSGIQKGSSELVISLEGIALGNPWLDPFYQYDASDFAHGLGLISAGQKHRLKELEGKCQQMLNAGKYNNAACFSLLDKVVDSTAVGATERVLMYDTRKFVKQTSSFPPGHEVLERYLNRPDVKAAIHATGSPNKFEECANPPFFALAHQDGKGISKELGQILDQGLRVLVFAGQYDLICNHLGIERVLRRVAWQGQKDWMLTAPGVWSQNGKPVGFVRAHQNLEFLIVLDSGHMVPMDQPATALSMIQTFLQNRRFATSTSQAKLGVSLAAPGIGEVECPHVLANTSTIASSTGSGSGAVGSGARPSGGAGTGGGGMLGGLSFWPGQNKKKAGGPHVRKARGTRRNFGTGVAAVEAVTRTLSSEESEIQGDEREGALHRRRLAEEHSQPPPYALVLGHVTPLNESVLVRVRLVHHGAAAHLQQSHHLDATTAAAALAGFRFEILVEPGHRAVAVELPPLLQHHLTGDIVIGGLRDGVEHSISAVWVDALGVKNPSSMRVIRITPGCFDATAVQCCSNGICTAGHGSGAGATHSKAVCRCDKGYSGPQCNIMAHAGTNGNHSVSTAVTCPAHFHAHAALVHNNTAPVLPAVLAQRAGAGDVHRNASGGHAGSAAGNITVQLPATSQNGSVREANTVIRVGVASTADSSNAVGVRVAPSSSPAADTTSSDKKKSVVYAEVVLMLQPDKRDTPWQSAAQFDAHYAHAVAELLKADLAVLQSRTPSVAGTVKISVSVAEKGTASGSVSADHTRTYVVRLKGPTQSVDGLVAKLQEELKNADSELRKTGAMGPYLSPEFHIREKVSQKPQEDETEQLNLAVMVGALVLSTVGAGVTLRWLRQRSSR